MKMTEQFVYQEQIFAARAVDMPELVARYIPLRREGRRYVGSCPFHKEKTASFGVEHGRHNYKCFGCGAYGDAVDFVRAMENCSFAEAVARLAGEGNCAPKTGATKGTVERSLVPNEPAVKIWREAQPVAGSIVERYLRARGIETALPLSLRFAAAFDYAAHVTRPAMLAAVQAPTGVLLGFQATPLHPSGTRREDTRPPRRTFGPIGTGAVRLARAADVLGIAEGVEDALAAMQLTSIPCWACLGAQRMHNVIFGGVSEVHIFADDDEAGRMAADRTASAHVRIGRRAVIRLPPQGFKDWADVAAARRRAA